MPPSTSHRVAACIALGLSLLALSGCGGAQARKAKHLAKGNAYLTAGNYEKARVEFQNALQISPLDPEARFDNGVVEEKLGKVREAAQFYQGVIDISPDPLAARTNLARLYVFAGLPDRALEAIQPALDRHRDDPELLALRAAARVQKKEMGEAQEDAEHAVKLDPKNPDAIATLAGIYTSQHEPGKAEALLEEGVRQLPSTVDLRMALAQVYSNENRAADAERLLLEVVRLRPDEPAQRIRLAQFYAHQNQLDAAERVLREGVKALPKDRSMKLSLIDFVSSRRSPDAAEKELLGMVAADPGDIEMKFDLAQFYDTNHQPERAEKIYREVIEREKLDAAGLAARDRLALLLLRRNDTVGTQKLIGEVLAKSPRDNEALILRGNMELANEDPKSAIADFRSVLRDQPNSAGVLRTLARAHLANGEPAIAEETLRRAVDASPKDAGARLELAQLLVQMGKPEQAKPLVADLVKEEPGNISALDAQFRIDAATKDYDGARSAAETMVATQPKSPVGYMYEGMLAEEAKHTDVALRLYGQAADLQPDALEPLQAQVRLLANSKRLPEAARRLDEVTAKVPASPFAPNIKGDLLLAQGNVEGAQAAYRMAIARAPRWWMPYRGLASAQIAAKNPDAALATLRGAQPSVDQPEQLGLEIAAYYEHAGKPGEAIQEYEQVIQHNPHVEVAANNLAMLLVTFDKDPASIDRAKSLSARFANSSNPSFLDTYGWVLFKHGEAAASVPILERVVSKAPDAPVALYHLGMAQLQAGEDRQGRANLARAVNSGAKFSGLDDAKATLNKLTKSTAESASKT